MTSCTSESSGALVIKMQQSYWKKESKVRSSLVQSGGILSVLKERGRAESRGAAPAKPVTGPLTAVCRGDLAERRR